MEGIRVIERQREQRVDTSNNSIQNHFLGKEVVKTELCSVGIPLQKVLEPQNKLHKCVKIWQLSVNKLLQMLTCVLKWD